MWIRFFKLSKYLYMYPNIYPPIYPNIYIKLCKLCISKLCISNNDDIYMKNILLKKPVQNTLSCCALSSSYWVLYLRPIFLTWVIVLTFSWISIILASKSFWMLSFSVLTLFKSSFRLWIKFWLLVKDAFDLSKKNGVKEKD